MDYFKDSEFQCKCGKCPPKPVNALLRDRLNQLRGRYGKPIYISSGWRCEAQNSKVGGVADSSHVTGYAVDILCTGSSDRFQLVSHAVGIFSRIGIGTTFVHLDVDETKDQGVIWLYGQH